MKDLRGVFPALLTPFNASGSVDEGAVRALVDLLIAEGAKGFYLTGSTGECHLLTLEERTAVVRAATRQIAGRAAVIVHVGTPGTDLSVRLGREAVDAGADALSAVPPFYYKYGFSEIAAHYEAIISATGAPMIIYNFPALSGVNFTLDNMRTFGQNPLIVGVKHTSPDLFQLERIMKTVPRFTLYNGHDEVFLAGLSMGAHGAIGSTFNFMLPRALAVKSLFERNLMPQALAEQKAINDIIDAVLAAGNFQATKYLVGRKGVPCGGCRSPFKPLSPEMTAALDRVYDEYLK